FLAGAATCKTNSCSASSRDSTALIRGSTVSIRNSAPSMIESAESSRRLTYSMIGSAESRRQLTTFGIEWTRGSATCTCCMRTLSIESQHLLLISSLSGGNCDPRSPSCTSPPIGDWYHWRPQSECAEGRSGKGNGPNGSMNQWIDGSMDRCAWLFPVPCQTPCPI